MSNMPSGPWLTVLGMHRSGTSAIAGALGAMGFNTPHPDDRVDWPESNSEHWESTSLTVYDDALLADLGGSWEAPPDLPPEWEESATVLHAPDPLPATLAAYSDDGPLVWKDPRLCLLLPYWRRILPKPLAAVLIWRSPLSVARSLQKRDGMHLVDGIALWERYNRSALTNLVGLDTYVCNYEAVVDDPPATMTAIANWLSTLPQFTHHSRHWRQEHAAATITVAPPYQPDDQDELLLLAQQRELIVCLSALGGGHLPLSLTSLPNESSWTTAVIAARRGGHRAREYQRQLQNKLTELDKLRKSTSWRVTKPLRSLASLANSYRPKDTRP